MRTYKDHQTIVISGVYGYRNSFSKKPKPFDKLSKESVEEELASREEYDLDRKKKPELVLMLNNILSGCQLVPALLFNQPTADLTILGLDDYEMLLCEPLHDISKHIEHIF